ncbi:LYR motif-containing protein 9-like [Physella acuta]|uniref:LYR motif-containing protein 9-like n=1 Tax=Physella acuta TaxID=109671 RepID=UPI0027DC46C9|nr:LYR motif-containing protein 9-like [Physella acuta]XP_059144516.1 LYR motif-containing protein 9-like [Physella acuta]
MAAVKSPIHLYRHLLRCVRKLPADAQPYYKHNIKQGFKSHSDETDKERIQQIIERAIEDAEWVIQKYAAKQAKPTK